MMRTLYNSLRKCYKWWRVIFYWGLETAVNNAYVQYRLLTGRTLTARKFRIMLMHELAAKYFAAQKKHPRVCLEHEPDGGYHRLESVVASSGGEQHSAKLVLIGQDGKGKNLSRRCKVCINLEKPIRRETVYKCEHCQIAFCVLCSGKCSLHI